MTVDGVDTFVKTAAADSGCSTSAISSNHPLIVGLKNSHPELIFRIQQHEISGISSSTLPVITAVDLNVSIPEIPSLGTFPLRLHIAEAMDTPLILIGIEDLYEHYIGASLFPRPPPGSNPRLDAHFQYIDKVHEHLLVASADNPTHRRLVNSPLPYLRQLTSLTLASTSSSISPVIPSTPLPMLVATPRSASNLDDFLPESSFYVAPSSARSTDPLAPDFGLGVFSKVNIKPRQKIRPFTPHGDWINEAEWRLRCMRGEGQYMLSNHDTPDSYYDCFPALDSCLMSRVNSCTRAIFFKGRLANRPVLANCILVFADNNFHLEAIRYIQPDDELTFSYGSDYRYPGRVDSHYSSRPPAPAIGAISTIPHPEDVENTQRSDPNSTLPFPNIGRSNQRLNATIRDLEARFRHENRDLNPRLGFDLNDPLSTAPSYSSESSKSGPILSQSQASSD
jgi:hypothetical protein